MTRIAQTFLFAALTGFFLALGSHSVYAQSAAAAQVCAEIMAEYGIAPEGCDPEADAKRAAVEQPKQTAPRQTAASNNTMSALTPEMRDSTIFFTLGGSNLDAVAQQRLDLLADVLATDIAGMACLQLVGHSDTSGPAEPNRRIALARANAVAGYLRPKMDDPTRIEAVVTVGEDEPLPGVSGDDPVNRRVTIYARDCPAP